MIQVILDKTSDKLKKLEYNLFDIIYFDNISPGIFDKLLNFEEVDILQMVSSKRLDILTEKKTDIKRLYQTKLNYLKDISSASTCEKSFFVFQTVRASGETHKQPYILFPIEMNVEKVTMKLIGKPIINPLISKKYGINLKSIKTYYEIDSVENTRAIQKDESKIYQDLFITNFDVASSATNISTKFITRNYQKSTSKYVNEDCFSINKQKAFIVDQIVAGDNVAVIGEHYSGKSVLTLNAIIKQTLQRKNILYISNDYESFKNKLIDFDLINVTEDLTNQENEIRDFNLEKIEVDYSSYLLEKNKISRIEEGYTKNIRGFNLVEAFSYLINSKTKDDYYLQEIEHIDYAHLQKIKKLVNSIKKIENKIKKECNIQDSHLSNLKLDNVKNVKLFSEKLEAHKNSLNEMIDTIESFEKTHKVELPKNMFELYSNIKNNEKFDLKKYPEKFLTVDIDKALLIEKYKWFNTKVTRLVNTKNMISNVFSDNIFKYDFKKNKDNILGSDVNKTIGLESVNEIVKNSYLSKIKIQLFEDLSKKFESELEKITVYFSKEQLNTKTIDDIVRLLLKNGYYKRYKDSLVITEVYRKSFELYEALEITDGDYIMKQNEFKLYYTKLKAKKIINKNKAVEFKKVKEYLDFVKKHNLDNSIMDNVYNYLIEERISNNFTNLYKQSTTNYILSLKNDESRPLAVSLRKLSNLYREISEIDIVTPKENYHEFIEVNKKHFSELKSILETTNNFNKMSHGKNVEDLNMFLKFDKIVTAYKTDLADYEKYKKDIVDYFSIYYDSSKKKFVDVLPYINDFYTVKNLFIDYKNLVKVNKQKFYEDVKKLTTNLKQFIKNNNIMFSDFYLNVEKFSNIYELKELFDKYNYADIKDYDKYVSELSVLIDYKQYNLVTDIKNGSVPADLSSAIERAVYLNLLSTNKVEKLELDKLEEFFVNARIIFKNRIVDFNETKATQKIIQNKRLGKNKTAYITLCNIDKLSYLKRKFDVVYIEDAQKFTVDDFEYIKTFAKQVVVTGNSYTDIAHQKSLVENIEKNSDYYELDRIFTFKSNSSKSTLQILNKTIDFTELAKEIIKIKSINIFVKDKKDRLNVYEKLAEELFLISEDAINYLKKIRIYTVNTKTPAKAEKSVIIIEEELNEENYLNLFNRVTLICKSLDVFDKNNLIDKKTLKLIEKEINIKAVSDLTLSEKFLIDQVNYEYEKGIDPISVIFKKGSKRLGVIMYFDKNYKDKKIYEDIDKLSYEKKYFSDICLVNVSELYFDKKTVIKRIKEKLND